MILIANHPQKKNYVNILLLLTRVKVIANLCNKIFTFLVMCNSDSLLSIKSNNSNNSNV